MLLVPYEQLVADTKKFDAWILKLQRDVADDDVYGRADLCAVLRTMRVVVYGTLHDDEDEAEDEAEDVGGVVFMSAEYLQLAGMDEAFIGACEEHQEMAARHAEFIRREDPCVFIPWEVDEATGGPVVLQPLKEPEVAFLQEPDALRNNLVFFPAITLPGGPVDLQPRKDPETGGDLPDDQLPSTTDYLQMALEQFNIEALAEDDAAMADDEAALAEAGSFFAV